MVELHRHGVGAIFGKTCLGHGEEQVALRIALAPLVGLDAPLAGYCRGIRTALSCGAISAVPCAKSLPLGVACPPEGDVGGQCAVGRGGIDLHLGLCAI